MSPSTPQAPPRTTPHVVVIGAGAFGGWTALHLLRSGARVTLLDAWGPANPRSSSGEGTRMIRALYPDHLYVNWVSHSITYWRELEARYGRHLFHRTGVLWMYRTEDRFVRDSLPFMKEEGLRVTELGLDEARRRWPQLSFEGLRAVHFEEEAGFIDARQGCEAVRDAFVREGGTWRVGMVRPPEEQGGRLDTLRLTDGETLPADRFVFACGPWMGGLFPQLLGKRIVPSRQEVFYFGPPPGDTRFNQEALPVCTDSGQRFIYALPASEQRGFKVGDDTPGEDFDPTRGDRIASAAGLARARAYLAERLPALADAPLLESRVCQYENSPDRHFILDRHPALENVWLAGGGSGHGFKFGPVVGEYMAELVLREEAPMEGFSLARLE